MSDWVSDYGTVTAAVIAALGLLHELRFRRGEWLRQTRLPRYAGFLSAAFEYQQALIYEYAEPDGERLKRRPAGFFNADATRSVFVRALSEVALVGPTATARAAKAVQYAFWAYIDQLERDPFDYDQSRNTYYINQFIGSAKRALSLPVESADELLTNEQWREVEELRAGAP